MKEFLAHLFIPRQSNKHRARALHFSSLLFYIVLVGILHVSLSFIPSKTGLILGYASNITVNDLLKDTNEKRAENGLSPVVLNDQLSQAAALKAANMFAEQYWAHVAPSGKDPWYFIRQIGYNYLYAGENLARDFPDSKSVVDAWMNSPTHRENIVNSRYKDIGFAVVNGKYGSYETTLVVQMFGTRPGGAPTVETNDVVVKPENVKPLVVQSVPVDLGVHGTESVKTTPTNQVIDVFKVTKIALLGLSIFLLLLLVWDAFLAYHRKAVRISGHNFAHFLILMAVVLTVLLIKRGTII